MSTLLKVGEVAPTLAGTTVDGKPFTTAPGQPTAVLFTARGVGGTMREAFDAAASAVTGVRSIVVQENPAGTVAGYLAGHPTSAAVVADPERALAGKWRVNFLLATVLLDDQGRVVALGKQRMSEADVRAQLEALRDGSPIPEPQPPPEITPYPEPSERIEGSSGGLGRLGRTGTLVRAASRWRHGRRHGSAGSAGLCLVLVPGVASLHLEPPPVRPAREGLR